MGKRDHLPKQSQVFEVACDKSAKPIEPLYINEIGPDKFHKKRFKLGLIYVRVQHHIGIKIAAFLDIVTLHEIAQNKPSLKTKQIVFKGHVMNMLVYFRKMRSGLHVIVHPHMDDPILCELLIQRLSQQKNG
jgi:hypothetical protein